MSLLNPWLIIVALGALIAATGIGYRLGGDSARASLYEEIKSQQDEAEKLRAAAVTYATHYETQRQASLDTASQLRRRINEHRNQLANCDGRFVLLNAQFMRLRNEAMQPAARDSDEPSGTTAGTVTPEELLENDIENGQRWKQCRDQLNALIEALK